MDDPATSNNEGMTPTGSSGIGSGSRRLLPPEIKHRFAVEVPDRVEDFNPAELVISVGAATPITRLLKSVQEHQLVPCGVQPDELGTVGGLFSDPREGPCDPFTGRFRDHVLGIEGFRGDGSALLSGGKVVKNVTGYDLIRLLGGAMGALGVVTRLHLRLERVSPGWALVSLPFDHSSRTWEQLDQVRLLPIEPYLLCIEPEKQRIRVVLAGTKNSISESHQLLGEVISGSHAETIDQQEVTRFHRLHRADPGVALRIRLPWTGWKKIAASAPGTWRAIFPSAGFGILEHVASGNSLRQLVQDVSQLGGSVCAEDAMAEDRYQIPIVHPFPFDKLTKQLRREWDPQGLLAWRGERR
ncbi:MAG: FAD-binding oxidoreductase [Planctomycetota bacterium]|nr:FAD-binding oxidoreductase [Planctomycetota bacterium]